MVISIIRGEIKSYNEVNLVWRSGIKKFFLSIFMNIFRDSKMSRVDSSLPNEM